MTKRLLYVLVLLCKVGSALPLMQDTGLRPVRYEYFDLPWDALSIAARYLRQDPVIVEAGAFDGRESCTLANYWPRGHVHAFEPVRRLYETVQINTQSMPNISTYNCAVGDSVGQLPMYLSTEPDWQADRVSMSSSVYAPKDHLLYSSTQFTGREMVNMTTLDQWAQDHNISRVDMLWLDMQGYELAALKAAPTVLSNVSVILTELEFCEAYANQPLYLEVKAWLESQGFTLIAGNFHFPRKPNQWFGDGLFVRSELIVKNKLRKQ